MHLCLDIGNTNIKLGVFKHTKIVHHDIMKDLSESSIRQLQNNYPITKAIISSTADLAPSIIKLIEDNFELLLFDHKTPVPITNNYHTPETLGTDRIIAAVAAHTANPNLSHLIIDAGTCITMDFIDDQGIYWGGNISPGIHMRIRAMDEFTDKLPSVSRKYHRDLIGKSTEHALQNGAVRGTIFEIQSFIRLMKRRKNNINTILTGGDSKFLGKYLKTKIFVSPNLLLEGLNQILIYNEN